jgi:multisubunit Na+/H+ antiporter MnhC subunit
MSVAIGFMAQYMVGGTQWVEDHLNLHPPAWMGSACWRVMATGLGSLVFGYPLLTTHTAHLDLPVLGDCTCQRPVRHRRVLRWCSAPTMLHADGPGPPVAARTVVAPAAAGRAPLMEIVIALAIGVLTGAGVWLVLRPRTFQVLMGLSLLSYATNLFIFSVGSLSIDREPIVQPGRARGPVNYTDPMPQALVLTAIVIGFATTALFLVVLLALRGLTGSDHVDGEEEGQ